MLLVSSQHPVFIHPMHKNYIMNLNAISKCYKTSFFSGDRVFPPQTGLTYSTWICVEKYSDPRSDPHCVRLLTLVRNISNSRDEHLVCLTIVLSARDKAIIISTQETLLPHSEYSWCLGLPKLMSSLVTTCLGSVSASCIPGVKSRPTKPKVPF